MWTDLLSAIALVLVIEGIMPFVAPHYWRGILARISQLDDNSMRVTGGVMMGLGLAFLYFIRG